MLRHTPPGQSSQNETCIEVCDHKRHGIIERESYAKLTVLSDTEKRDIFQQARKRTRGEFETHIEETHRAKRVKLAQMPVMVRNEEFQRYEDKAARRAGEIYRIPQRRSSHMKRTSSTPDAANISKRLEAMQVSK